MRACTMGLARPTLRRNVDLRPVWAPVIIARLLRSALTSLPTIFCSNLPCNYFQMSALTPA